MQNRPFHLIDHVGNALIMHIDSVERRTAAMSRVVIVETGEVFESVTLEDIGLSNVPTGTLIAAAGTYQNSRGTFPQLAQPTDEQVCAAQKLMAESI